MSFSVFLKDGKGYSYDHCFRALAGIRPNPRSLPPLRPIRSRLYLLAGEGQVRFIKVGTATLVDLNSVSHIWRACPSASIRRRGQHDWAR